MNILKKKIYLLVIICFTISKSSFAQTGTSLKFNYGYFTSHSDGFFSEVYLGAGFQRHIYEHLSVGFTANWGLGHDAADESIIYQSGSSYIYSLYVNHRSFMINYNSRFYPNSDNHGFYVASNLTYKSVSEEITYNGSYVADGTAENKYVLFPLGISIGASGDNDWYSDFSFGVYYNLGDKSASGKLGSMQTESFVNTFSFQLNYTLGIKL